MIDIVTGLFDLLGNLANHADNTDAGGWNIHGNPDDLNTFGNRPSDIQGTSLGNDIHGNPNNRWFNN